MGAGWSLGALIGILLAVGYVGLGSREQALKPRGLSSWLILLLYCALGPVVALLVLGVPLAWLQFLPDSLSAVPPVALVSAVIIWLIGLWLQIIYRPRIIACFIVLSIAGTGFVVVWWPDLLAWGIVLLNVFVAVDLLLAARARRRL
jgi:hypothetical protein